MIMKHLYTREEKIKMLSDGEWVDEPDEVDFEYEGFNCFIRRPIAFGGHLCGYIKIPKNHPWFELDYDNIPDDIHGGLTYSGRGHINQDDWMIGFDCAHSSDLTPSFLILQKETGFDFFPYGTYKNLEYVINECKSLVNQAKKAMVINET